MPNASLVSLSHVDVDRGERRVLRDISLRIDPGAHLGIVGSNGSGKTTLLALIAGHCWPAPGRGKRIYDFGLGPERDAISARSRITLLGPELQDLYRARGWNFRARDVVLSGVTRSEIPRRRVDDDAIASSAALLDRLSLGQLAERRFLELSRGEQRRVLIARALAFRPALLLLDEVASGLDVSARRMLDELLRIVAESTTLVCTAHTAGDLPEVTTRITSLAGGRLTGVESAPADERSPAAVAGEPRTRGSAIAAAEPMERIVLENVSVWLDERQVLCNLNWTLKTGEHWLVTGPNGAGKSTLLRLLHAEVRPARGGRIRWPGTGNGSDVWALRRRVALVSPELQARYRFPATVAEAVASGFRSSIGLTRPLDARQRDRVDELLALFRLEAERDTPIANLSYGQRHRTLIARTLVHEPAVLLLDEPWEGLDPAMTGLVVAALDDCVRAGMQLVTVSHVGARGLPVNRELRLDGGRIVSAGEFVEPRESSSSAQPRAADCPQR